MEFQLIRSATIKIKYAGQYFVIDPYLAAKHSRPSYSGKSPNPLVDLPCKPEDVIRDIDFLMVSHLHSDHFDPAAQELVPKDMALLCHPGDEVDLRKQGFINVKPISNSLTMNKMKISRTSGQHGTGEVLNEMGEVSGFVFKADNEPTVYWAGDTIWCDAVQEVLERVKPDIIITHSCGAVWGDHVFIVMDAEQTIKVCQALANTIVIATHMDSVDHATVTRKDLRQYANSQGIDAKRLLIPQDGERLTL